MPALFRGPVKGYKLTPLDVEWLARSMWGEEEADDINGKIAVAWTHINRFLLVNYKWLQLGWPFYRYIQGHSQPINPDWARDGKFCRVGGKYHGTKHCSEDKLAKRDMFQKGPVPQQWMDLAQQFAEGMLPNPFSEPTYDFAADWLIAKQGRPCNGTLMGKAPFNAHLTYACLKSDERKAVVPGAVYVETQDPMQVHGGAIIPIGTAVLVAAVAGAIFYALVRRGVF